MSSQLDALTRFVQRLVQTRSVTANEQDVVEVIVSEMNALGYDRVWVDKFGNAIGMIEGRQPGPTLLMDGHCDTVEADAADWSLDPWSGAFQNGRIYGRGAADMKGSLGAMVYAASAIERNSLAGRVVVSATVSEETVEGGTIKNVIDEVHPDFVIIGEATELNLNRGGRGRAEIKVTTYGRSAHSSSPQAGHCAVTDMVQIINAISDRPAPQDPLLGSGSIVLTDIISEPYPGRSVIPYRCHVTYDRRLLPGERKEGVLDSLQVLPSDKIKYSVELKTNTETTYTGQELRGDKFFPAWVFPEEHPLVQMALKGLQSAGLQPKIGAYRFCTNAAYSAGTAGIPTVGFGIGREEDAHVIDESIFVDDLYAAVRGYTGMIQVIASAP